MDARLDRGRLYLAARNYSNAEEEANFILQKEAGNAAAYQLLGACLLGERKNEQALQAFSKIAELLPVDPSSYINLALVELSLGRNTDAEQYFKKAVEVDQHSVQAYADLANFYRLRGNNPEAEGIVQQGIDRNPQAAGLYIVWADLLYNQQRENEAEALLDKLRRQAYSGASSIAIGDFYFQRKQNVAALNEYLRGLTVAPDDLEIKKRIEDLYLISGQTQAAADLDKELLKKSPKDPLVRVSHGRLLMKQGKLDEAIAELQKDVKDVPDSPQAHYFLGAAYWQKSDTEQAKSEMAEALRLLPDLSIARDSLIRLHLQNGDPSVALQYAEAGVQQHPADGPERLLLGAIYLRQGKIDRAKEQFLVAQQLTPSDPQVPLALARTAAAAHQWNQAEQEFEREATSTG